MSEQAFDLAAHQRQRIRELDARCMFLEGERERLELLLATLLQIAARTAKCSETLILDALITITGIDPAKAHIHDQQPLPVPAETKADA